MNITAIKTSIVTPRSCTLIELLDEFLPDIQENNIVSITSKVVSLCEGRVVPLEGTDKEKLIQQESDQYMPVDFGKYGFHFTITRKTLISMAGIDESNGAGHFVLWPTDPQATANEVREYLVRRFGLKQVGVIITDSTCMPPMRAGTVGVLLAHSGFKAVRSEVGNPDLFGRPFHFSKAGVGSGLAAAANLVMGEGRECTPIVVMSDLPFVTFEPHSPTNKELESVYFHSKDDLYAPFLDSVEWREGGHGTSRAAQSANGE